MARKNVQLLLTANVDNLGIVGDLVTVRLGYARNYLLPMGFATTPSDDRLAQLAAARVEAQKQMAALRSEREKLVERMAGLEMTLERSCNDQGVLYGSVTQQDLASALTSLGFPVKPREVRLPQVIKRVGDYEIHVKFDSDLETTVHVWVEADRQLVEEREEMEFDNEGNLIERPKKGKGGEPKAAAGAGAASAPAREAPAS